MEKFNKNRGGCKDVFHAFLVEHAQFDGMYGIPVLRDEHRIPRRLIRFSETLHEKNDFNQWVMFYEDDHKFERIWNNPRKYLHNLRRYEGVITPDFSLYYDMPLAMQIWNIYRSRAVGTWLQYNGVRVIPNIRFGAPETYEIACNGVSKHGTIAIGTLGCLGESKYRKEFEKGVTEVAERLSPETIVFCGGVPTCSIELKTRGINIVNINPNYSFLRKEVE